MLKMGRLRRVWWSSLVTVFNFEQLAIVSATFGPVAEQHVNTSRRKLEEILVKVAMREHWYRWRWRWRWWRWIFFSDFRKLEEVLVKVAMRILMQMTATMLLEMRILSKLTATSMMKMTTRLMSKMTTSVMEMMTTSMMDWLPGSWGGEQRGGGRRDQAAALWDCLYSEGCQMRIIMKCPLWTKKSLNWVLFVLYFCLNWAVFWVTKTDLD